MASATQDFDSIWLIDFEYVSEVGERPDVVCLVAINFVTGEVIRLWRDQVKQLTKAPFDTGPCSLIVMYYGPAEMGCFHALGWPIPERMIDLFAEFRVKTNGHHDVFGRAVGKSLLAALKYYDLEGLAAAEKTEMRDLILSGGPWSDQEQQDILSYCKSDVRALARLWGCMVGDIGASMARFRQALFRGQFGAAIAFMEHNGVPIDAKKLALLKMYWGHIKNRLISEIDKEYGFYEGSVLKVEKVAEWLAEKKIPWPQTATGQPCLDKDTLKDLKKSYPEIALFAELRSTLNAMRLDGLAVGADGRNRTMLSPYGAKTGRNLPSTSSFIFGPSTWMRGLIKPGKGNSVAYLDWKSQEVFIAAVLSGDAVMLKAYQSGDVYLAFAKLCGIAPEDATKESHKIERDRCKAIILGMQYGRQAKSISAILGVSEFTTQCLIDQYWGNFHVFAKWVQKQADAGMMGHTLETLSGWPLQDQSLEPNPRTFMNFQMQATGANMMQFAACLAREAGLKIICPVHDALMLEAPTELIDDHVARLLEIMETASAAVTNSGGPTCPVDVNIVRYPQRYMDEGRGRKMWMVLSKLLGEAIKNELLSA